MRRALSTETFLAALAVLGVACGKKAAPAASNMTAEPPAASAVATAVPPPATDPAPTLAQPTGSTQGDTVNNAPPPKVQALPVRLAPGKNSKPTASAGCGANGCSPDMKKGSGGVR